MKFKDAHDGAGHAMNPTRSDDAVQRVAEAFTFLRLAHENELQEIRSQLTEIHQRLGH